MRITVNGAEREIEPGTTLEKLMETLKISRKVMAAAVNMQIVKKEQWSSYILSEDDRVELLHFVGGG